MSKPFKASVVQAGSALFDTPHDGKVRSARERCGRRRRETRCLSRSLHRRLSERPSVRNRRRIAHAGRRDWFRRYFESAIDVPGRETAEIARLAKDPGADIVVGVIERAAANEGSGALYCAALTFSREGALIGKRRKLMPTAAERLIWGFGDGSTLEA